MATKIRLSRHGKKGYPFYHIVVADARAPRDGRFIEKLGTYNPNTNPAVIELNFDSAVSWISKGAQPTDTVRSILSYKGVMMMHHLNGGVKKGALTAEQAEVKFEGWLKEKEGKVQSKKDGLVVTAQKDAKDRFAAETKAKEDREKALAAKLAAAAKIVTDAAAAKIAAEVVVEEVVAEVAAEVVAEVAEKTAE